MTTANWSSPQGGVLWQAACISLMVQCRSSRSLLRARWFTAAEGPEPQGAPLPSPGHWGLRLPSRPPPSPPLAARGTVGRS